MKRTPLTPEAKLLAERRRAKALRASVKGLRLGMEMDRALLEHQRGIIYELRKEIEDAKAIVGSMSVLFPPAEKMRRGGKPERRVHAPQPCPDFGPNAPMESTSFVKKSLDTMLASVNIDKLKGHTHLYVEFADEWVAYAIGRDTLAMFPPSQRESYILRELVPLMAKELARKLGARG